MFGIQSYSFRKANSIKQKDNPVLKTIHIYTFKNRFKTVYIVNVEEYKHEMFILKFHTKAHKSSINKYNLLTKEGDARRIIFTCIKIAQQIHLVNERASFGFIGSPLMAEKRRKNRLSNTKRFRVYKKFAAFFFSPDSFVHSVDADHSSYLLFNRNQIRLNPDLNKDVVSMFENYFDLTELFQ